MNEIWILESDVEPDNKSGWIFEVSDPKAHYVDI